MVHAPFLEMVYKRQLNTFILTLHHRQDKQILTPGLTHALAGAVCYFLFNNLC